MLHHQERRALAHNRHAVEILKSQPVTKFLIHNEYGSDFREIFAGASTAPSGARGQGTSAQSSCDDAHAAGDDGVVAARYLLRELLQEAQVGILKSRLSPELSVQINERGDF